MPVWRLVAAQIVTKAGHNAVRPVGGEARPVLRVAGIGAAAGHNKKAQKGKPPQATISAITWS